MKFNRRVTPMLRLAVSPALPACFIYISTFHVASPARASTVLDGATLSADLTAVTVWVQNGLTLLNGAKLMTTGTGGGTDLYFHGTQSISGNGTVLLNHEHLSIDTDPNSPQSILTVGPGITIANVAGAGENRIESQYAFTGTLVNNGTIAAANGDITIGPFEWTNNGTLRSSTDGYLILENGLTNNGLIDVSDGGIFALLDRFNNNNPALRLHNNGTLRIHDGAIALSATYTPDQLGNTDFYNVTFVGGFQYKRFGLDYTGRTLDLNASTGNVTFQGDGYFTGTLKTRDAKELILTSLGNGVGANTAFDNLNLDGTIRSIQANIYFHTTFAGTLTMAPSSLVNLKGDLVFAGPSATVTGSGEIAAASVNGDHYTLSPGITLRSSATSFTTSGTVTNYGTVLLDRPGGSYSLGGPAWLNAGSVRVTAGSLSLNASATSFTNTGTVHADGPTASVTFAGPNPGTLRATSGGSLTLSGAAFANTGSILADTGGSVTLASGPYPASLGNFAVNAATLRIATPFTLPQLASITPTSATYAIVTGGALDLGGATTPLPSQIAWQLASGKLANGTLASALTSTGSTGTLDNVTLAADSSITTGNLSVLNNLGLANAATLSMASTATLNFTGSQSITGNGTIAFDGLSNALRPAGTSATLTITPGITVRTGIGSGTVGLSTLPLLNQGTLSAQTPGQTLTLTGANWTNAGTLQAKNGGTLKLAGTFTTAALGTLSTDTGGTILLAGTLDNTGATLALSPAPAIGLTSGATVNGGSITSDTAATPLIAYSAQSTLKNVDVTAPILLLPGSSLVLSGSANRGGITGNGGLILNGPWSNPGSISIGAGGSLNLVANNSLPADFGSISLTDATFIFSTLLTTPQLNNIGRTRSLAVVASQLTNTGNTLNITPEVGNVRLTGGSIVGGTVVTTGDAELQVDTSATTIDDITLMGNLTLLNGGIPMVTAAGLHPVGAHISLASTTNTTSLKFFGSQTLTGTADITFDGSTRPGLQILNSVAPIGSGSETLTLGPGITIRTRTNSGIVGGPSASFYSVINNGTLSASAAARDLVAQALFVTNNATFEAKTGGALVVNANTFTNAGLVTVAATSTLKITATTLNNTGRIDLDGGNAIVDYPAASPSMAPWVRAQLAAGRATGSWDGATGITSSAAADDPASFTAIGYAEASLLLGLSGNVKATWSGQTVDSTSLLLKITSYGDANLDGRVTADDYAILDRGYARAATDARWTDGDFNYDGLVTAADFLLTDAVYLRQSGGTPPSPEFLATRAAQFGPDYVSSLLVAVPEPTTAITPTLALIAAAARMPRHRLRPPA